MTCPSSHLQPELQNWETSGSILLSQVLTLPDRSEKGIESPLEIFPSAPPQEDEMW